MDNEPKTVGGVSDDSALSLIDPLTKSQMERVDSMRSTMLSFDPRNFVEAKYAMQNVTVLRIYHQVARIIKFINMMDQLEDKIYDSITMNIGSMDSCDPMTMMTLLKVQSQLQETMIQSQLLLKPYLDLDIEAIAPPREVEENSFGVAIIPQESRNNIRSGAQALLTELRKQNPELPQTDETIDGDSNDRDANTQ